jgi:hypothetical protein
MALNMKFLWFGDQQKALEHEAEESKALEHKEIFPKTLLAQFNDSAYGTYCRTQAFKAEDLGYALWRKAVYNPDETGRLKWSVYEVRESDVQFTDPERGVMTPNKQIKKLTDKLSYFEAIKALATFELAPFVNPDLSYERTGQSAQELGSIYYKTLANSDGIIFDLENSPHPTQAGSIVTEGRFAVEDIEALNIAMGKNTKDLSADIPGMLHKIMEASRSLPVIDPDSIIRMHDMKDELDKCLLVMRAYSGFLRISIETDYDIEHKDFGQLKKTSQLERKLWLEPSCERHVSSRPCQFLLEAPYFSYKNNLGKVSAYSEYGSAAPDFSKVKGAYVTAAKEGLDKLHELAKEKIEELEDEQLSKKLSEYLNELRIIRYLYDGRDQVDQARSLSNKGINPRTLLGGFNKAFEQIAQDIRALGLDLNEEQTEVLIAGFKNSVLHNQGPRAEEAPWEKYEATFKSIERDLEALADMISDEWGGKESHKKLPAPKAEQEPEDNKEKHLSKRARTPGRRPS